MPARTPAPAAAVWLQVRLLRNTSSLEEARGRLPSIYNTGRYDPAHIWNVS
jgi:hypothetical protein